MMRDGSHCSIELRIRRVAERCSCSCGTSLSLGALQFRPIGKTDPPKHLRCVKISSHEYVCFENLFKFADDLELSEAGTERFIFVIIFLLLFYFKDIQNLRSFVTSHNKRVVYRPQHPVFFSGQIQRKSNFSLFPPDVMQVILTHFNVSELSRIERVNLDFYQNVAKTFKIRYLRRKNLADFDCKMFRSFKNALFFGVCEKCESENTMAEIDFFYTLHQSICRPCAKKWPHLYGFISFDVKLFRAKGLTKMDIEKYQIPSYTKRYLYL
jgi:hypothetical protein